MTVGRFPVAFHVRDGDGVRPTLAAECRRWHFLVSSKPFLLRAGCRRLRLRLIPGVTDTLSSTRLSTHLACYASRHFIGTVRMLETKL